MIKKLILILLKLILGIVFYLSLHLGVAYVLSRIAVEGEPDTPKEISIYILTNGTHTDIVLPVSTDQIDWSQQIKYEHTVSTDTTYSYIGIGWGDRTFYMNTPEWSDLKVSVALKAALGLSPSAMHTTYHKELKTGPHCKEIQISKEQYGRLIEYITDRFEQDAKGNFIPIATTANYGNNDAFYEANGSLSIYNTCNTWVNGALKEAGQRACVWTLFDTGIFLKYEE
ncbi:MAG: TIGR02117 family protein [Bacteroidota bacterium]